MQAGGCRETQTQWSGEVGELPTARSTLPTPTPLRGAQQLLQPEPAAGQAQLPWAVRRGCGWAAEAGVQGAHLSGHPHSPPASTQIYVLNHFRFHNILQRNPNKHFGNPTVLK